MPRRTSHAAAGELRCYIPDVDGNDLASELDQVRVWIRNPTELDKRRFQTDAEVWVRLDENGKPLRDERGNPVATTKLTEKTWRRLAILECVHRVENYERKTAEGWAPIATAEDFWTHGEGGFVNDVATEILTGYSLQVAEKKTSPESSAYTPRTIPPSDGIAGNAEQVDPQKPEGAIPVAQPGSYTSLS